MIVQFLNPISAIHTLKRQNQAGRFILRLHVLRFLVMWDTLLLRSGIVTNKNSIKVLTMIVWERIYDRYE